VRGGQTRGLLLRNVDGGLIASGDLLQVGRGGKVESRMVFHFKDGSLFDETVVFRPSTGCSGKHPVRPALALEQRSRHVDVQRFEKRRQLPIKLDAYL
jgi:hypothetical protein